MCIASAGQPVLEGKEMPGRWSNSKRYVRALSSFRSRWRIHISYQARFFKQMLKEADHLEKVKRLRVGEKELAPLLSHYEV